MDIHTLANNLDRLIGGFMSVTDKVASWIADIENVYLKRTLAVLAYSLVALVIVLGLVIELAVHLVLAAWNTLKNHYEENEFVFRDFIASFRSIW